MSVQGKSTSHTGFAWKEPGLRQSGPVSLRNLRAAHPLFNRVCDPMRAVQMKDMEKAEAKRREETGRGSEMVRLHRPFPDLRPKNDNTQLRASFNQAWLREQRAAIQDRFQSERKETTPGNTRLLEQQYALQQWGYGYTR